MKRTNLDRGWLFKYTDAIMGVANTTIACGFVAAANY